MGFQIPSWVLSVTHITVKILQGIPTTRAGSREESVPHGQQERCMFIRTKRADGCAGNSSAGRVGHLESQHWKWLSETNLEGVSPLEIFRGAYFQFLVDWDYFNGLWFNANIEAVSNSASRNGRDIESLYFILNSVKRRIALKMCCFPKEMCICVCSPHQTPHHPPSQFIIGPQRIILRNWSHSKRPNQEVYRAFPPAFLKLNALDTAQHHD